MLKKVLRFSLIIFAICLAWNFVFIPFIKFLIPAIATLLQFMIDTSLFLFKALAFLGAITFVILLIKKLVTTRR